jgi:histidinol-phosphate aminotransferase
MNSAVKRDRIRLSLNENPLGPSPLALQALKAELSNLSSYPIDAIAELKATIAQQENVAQHQIVLGEVLNVFGLYLSAHGGPGGNFIYSEPGYTALVSAVAPAGGNVIGIPLDGRLENDFSAISAKVNERTRAVYLVNPHNPTGIVAEKSTFIDRVRQLATRTLVVVDEAYLDFLPDFEERTAARLVRDGSRVVVFRTFSKLYGLAGLAFGYALAPPDLAAAMSELGVGAFFDVNHLSIVAANASLKDKRYVARVRARVKTERDAWHTLFRKHDVRFTDSQGNFVFFDARLPHQQVASALAGRGFDIGRRHPPLDTWVRISIGTPEENAIARSAVADLVAGTRSVG